MKGVWAEKGVRVWVIEGHFYRQGELKGSEMEKSLITWIIIFKYV